MEPGPTVTAATESRKPDWRLIGVFYSICLAWVSLIALGLYAAGATMSPTGTQLIFQFTVAFLYMPAPLVSALIAERVGKRSPLIRTTFRDFGRKLPRLVLTCVALSTTVYLTYLALAFAFGNALPIAGAGELVTTQAGLETNLIAIANEFAQGQGVQPPADSAASMPPLGVLYVATLLGGLIAGFTLNGLFAFGEEYGWRGFLMDELRPLGAVRANLLTGIMWGVWHAPIILLGFNFEPYRFLGVLAMVALCTALSFQYWRARQYTDSVLAPAALHGAFNAYGGVFLLLLVGRNPIIALPVGLLGTAGLAVVTFGFWRWSETKLAESPEPQTAADEPAGTATVTP